MKDEPIHFFSWDERRDIAHPGDQDTTLKFSIEHFANCAKEALKMHDYFAVALSGGSTPKAMFTALSNSPYSTAIDWRKVLLFWSDERSVPPTHEESNFRMAIEAGFKKLPILPEHTFRMEAENNIEESAKHYEDKIKEVLGIRPFDLIMLGMGDDGHIASLFPGTKALEEKERLVVANAVPQKNTTRMTMTFPLINRARNTVLYVMGEGKREMVKKIFLEKDEPPFPAARVGTSSNKALWIVDTAAGQDILKNK